MDKIAVFWGPDKDFDNAIKDLSSSKRLIDVLDIIDEKISSLGIFAPLAFICLEILQIVAAFVPGAPVEILGGVLFGGFWGAILCFAGIFTGWYSLL